MIKEKDVQPIVLAAGLIAVGGLFLFASRKKRRCEKLPGIYTEDGPIHLTKISQDRAFEAARYKLREYILAGEEYNLSDIVLYVADELRDCSWENLKTDEQKAVWSSIMQIVNEVNQTAKDDPEEFLKSFHEKFQIKISPSDM